MTPAAHVNKVCGLSRPPGEATWRESGVPKLVRRMLGQRQ